MPTANEILLKLGEYKYLTKSQYTSLGFKPSYISKVLKILELKDMIGNIKYCGKSQKTENFTREHIYFLKEKTAKEMMLLGHKAQYPKKERSEIDNDFVHRFYTVNVQLSFERWVEKNDVYVNLWKTYFSNSNEWLENATKINYKSTTIVPDFVAVISGDKKLRFVGELSNGIKTKNPFDKILQLSECVKNNLFSQYGWDKTPRVLCIMESENLKRNTIRWVNRDRELDLYAPMFLFSTIKEVVEDFDNWVDTKGEMIKLSDL